MRVCAIAFALLASGLLRSADAPPTLESFCENDVVIDPSLSPDGSKLAYLTSSGRDLALAVYHLDTAKGEILCKVDSHTTGFSWKGNDRILFVEALYKGTFLRSVSPGQHSLNSFPGFGDKRRIGSVFDWLPADPKHILVRMRQIGFMDVETGEMRETQPVESTQFVGPYVADATGALRLRCIQWSDGIELQHRRTDADTFVTAHKWNWSEPAVNFMGFGGDPNTAYFLTHDEGEWGIVRGFDTTTFKLGPPLATFKGAEIRSALYSRDGSKLIGLHVDGREGVFNYWLDDSMRLRQTAIDASLAGKRNRIVSWSVDMDSLVVLSQTGSEPGVYYSLDMRRKALVRLGGRHPQVSPAVLGKATAVDIATRDGFTIHGVLILPPGEAKGPRPLVLIPQDGIFNKRWVVGYGETEQFLATRGYAVLCVDYRGTWGYGRSYEDAGRREIAGKIPEDIEDAALWSVKSGYAASGRICIYGKDFAGTLALIAATYSPDLYCCAINQQGEADLTRYGEDYFGNSDWMTRKRIEMFIGDDTKALSRRSPLLAIDRLRGPLLNIYGDPEHDRSWDRLEPALRRAGKPYVLFKVLNPSDDQLPYDRRMNFYRQVGDFLDKNLRNPQAN
jgi:dipeptidyl aminopeptidase/acylaminoacyl peptidase